MKALTGTMQAFFRGYVRFILGWWPLLFSTFAIWALLPMIVVPHYVFRVPVHDGTTHIASESKIALVIGLTDTVLLLIAVAGYSILRLLKGWR